MDNAPLDAEKDAAGEEEEQVVFEELQCTTLVSCGQMACPKAFRAEVPEPVRFTLSGFLGSATMAALNALALVVLPESWKPNPAATIAWAFSYGLSIWVQHWLHSTLVYGWKISYWAGLAKTYAGYSTSYALSIPINAGLIWVGCSVWWAYVLTLVLTGCGNFFLFRLLLGGSKEPAVTLARQVPADTKNPLEEGMMAADA